MKEKPLTLPSPREEQVPDADQNDVGIVESESTEEEAKNIRTRNLNDLFRATLTGGDVYTTSGVNALGTEAGLEILEQVRKYRSFDEGNDPYGEHDFGSFDYAASPETLTKIFWKIDYYSKENEGEGSDDPSDTDKTKRCLTIMLAEEY